LSDIGLKGVAGLLAALLAVGLGTTGMLVGAIVVALKRRDAEPLAPGILVTRFFLGPIACSMAGAVALVTSWDTASDAADTFGVVALGVGIVAWGVALLIARRRR
jgi:tellurite resistance protein TehA-like permease